jgi:hypothetical protein
MTPSNSLQEYFEQCALLSREKQDRIEMLMSDFTHEFDLEEGLVRFHEGRVFPFQVLGTESYNTLTWLWAWSEDHTEVPTHLLASAFKMKDWGEKQHLKEFFGPAMDLNGMDGHALSLISSHVCNASCYVQDAYAGGAAYVLVFDKLIDAQPSFDRQRLFTHLADLTTRYEINQRNALLSYLQLKGLAPATAGSFINSELETGERLNAEFDGKGQLIVLNGSAFEI